MRAWTSQNIAAVSFQETGIGIPEDVKAKMFSPLFTTREKGVGLGLAVTKRLIESHRGEIKVFSNVGEGTTLTVELPIDMRRCASGMAKKILNVDDDRGILKSLKAILETEGYSVDAADPAMEDVAECTG